MHTRISTPRASLSELILIKGVFPANVAKRYQYPLYMLQGCYPPINPSTPCTTSFDRISIGDFSSRLEVPLSEGVAPPFPSHPRVHHCGRLSQSATLALDNVKVRPKTVPMIRSRDIRKSGRRGRRARSESVVADIAWGYRVTMDAPTATCLLGDPVFRSA